jgi:acyl-CoA synthetase (AMP-forming)/AMP-acid ligase II
LWISPQGFYDTMDAGYVDEDGFLYIMSRSDDVINVAGHRLSAGALEEVRPTIIIFIKDAYVRTVWDSTLMLEPLAAPEIPVADFTCYRNSLWMKLSL